MTKSETPLSNIGRRLALECLNGSTEGLLEQLKKLSANERTTLDSELRVPVEVALSTCFSSTKLPVGLALKTVTLFFEEFHASGTLQECKTALKERMGQLRAISSNGTASYPLIRSCLNLTGLLLGLAPRQRTLSILKQSRRITNITWGRGERVNWSPLPRFLCPIGFLSRTLLDRDESWVKDVLLEWFTDLHELFGESYLDGFSFALEDSLKEHPDWREDLRPFFGKAMVFDGFRHPDWHVRFDGEVVIAGLRHAGFESVSRESGARPFYDVFTTGRTALDYVLLMPSATRPQRSELISVALESLQTAQSEHFSKLWIGFLQKLSPSDEEVVSNASHWVNLLNAATTPGIQTGLDFCQKLLVCKKLDGDEVLGALTKALNHRQQTIALKAWKTAAFLGESDPGSQKAIAGLAMDALTTPHRKLRESTAKWLAKRSNGLSESEQEILRNLLPSLQPAERSILEKVLPPESSEGPIPAKWKDDLKSLVVKASRRESDLQPAQQASLGVVRGWLEKGVVIPLQPQPPTFNHSLVRNVVPYATPDAVALAFTEATGRYFTRLDFELLLDGIARFPGASQDLGIRKTLDPLLNYFEALQSGERIRLQSIQQHLGSFQATAVEAAFLAGVWVTEGKWSPPLLSVKSMTWRHRVLRVATFLARGKTAPILALPTNREGWIHPEDLVARLRSVAPVSLLDPDELAAALYRLAPSAKAKSHAWKDLEPILDGELISDALRIAFDSETNLRARAGFLAFFEKHPPEDYLFRSAVFGSAMHDPSNLVEIFQHPVSATFRLFVASLRASAGLESLDPVEVDLRKTIPFEYPRLQNFPSPFPISPEGEQQLKERQRVQELFIQKETEALSEFIRTAVVPTLFSPVPITPELLKGPPTLAPGQMLFFRDALSEYPILGTYRFAFIDEYTSGPWLHGTIEDQALDWPMGSQRLFEAGAARSITPQPTFSHHENSNAHTMPLAFVGHRACVDITGKVGHIIEGGLRSRHKGDIELLLTLLMAWLHDGRATPDDIMNALANGVLSEEVKFANFERAIISLMAASPAGSLIVIGTIEQALAGEFQKTTPRKQSQLLERLELLLAETGRVVESSDAREKLATLAAGKSAAGEKARRLLSATVPPNQPPLAVAIASALLDC